MSPIAKHPAPSDADDAAWRAVQAAAHGASLPERFRSHPLVAALLPVARPGPLVIAQLGQSLDGRVATASGDSRFINGPAGITHLHRLRALVDAVLVGVGTVLADDCRLTVRRVEGVSPARVIVDPRGRAPDGARAIADPLARRIVIRREGAPHCAVPEVETVHLPLCDGRIRPSEIIAALARRGLKRVLVEGGPATVSAFVAANALDRLHVVVAPLLVGSGRPGLSLAPIRELALARRPVTAAHMLGDGDVLFDCDMRVPADGSGPAAAFAAAEAVREEGEPSLLAASARGGDVR